MKDCNRCQATTQAGTRCKNPVACHLNCYKYCHVHSPGYPEKNEVCTTPVRRGSASPKKTVRKTTKKSVKKSTR